MAEGLSATEVGNHIAEHREHTTDKGQHDQAIAIFEAVLLSVVALLAAWSGFAAAKWGTEASLSLSRASLTRSEANVAEFRAAQIRTLDYVSFNAAATAFAAHDQNLFDLAVRRLRPGYKPAFEAWLALHPLTNPQAPADPSHMPQYRIPGATHGHELAVEAEEHFAEGETASATADSYVRLTVLLAAVLFLVGIGSRFPVRVARNSLVAVAAVLLLAAVVQLLFLPVPAL